jgi:hypothetical protein
VSGTRAQRTLLERVGWVPFVCVLGAMMLVALAGITWDTSPYWGRSNVQAVARNVGQIPVKAPPVAATPVISPNRIVIPKIKAEAPIVKVSTMPNGELEIPLNPKITGWWSPGAKPGATKGTAIIAGHINYAGVTGALSQIGTLNPGDLVYVYGTQNANHQAKDTFKITGVRTYKKTSLPYKQIFDQNSIGRLAIVTCGGPFDAATGNYLDNIVAFAVPV